MFNKLTTVKKMGAAVLGAGFMLMLFFLVLHFIGIRKDEVTALAEEVALLQGREFTLGAQRATVQDIARDRAVLDSYFLDETALVEFLESIEALGARTGTVVEVVSVNERELPMGEEIDGVQKTIPAITLAITAEGSWTQLFSFLVLLESVPMVHRVDHASLDVSAADTNPITWEGSFTLSVIRNAS